jgi:solute carrier family 25 protein 39/40
MTAEVRRFGPASLWRGVAPSAMRDVPFSALYWLCYDWMRSARLLSTNRRSLHTPEAALFGCAAGAVAGVATLPFDVVKTHRQVELVTAGARASPTVMKTLLELQSTLGTRALFTGVVPRLLKVIPASAVMLSTFEFMKNRFSELNERR